MRMVFFCFQPFVLTTFAFMETIPKNDCEKVGFFRKTHGVSGELVLEFEPQFEISIEQADRFFIEIEGLLVPFFITDDGFRYKTDNTAILKFNDVENEEYAKRMVGASVYLFKNEIVIMEDEFFESELENFLLIEEKLGEIGIIDHVDNFSGNIVITVNYKGKELLVPYNEDFLISIDKFNRIVTLRFPEGILDE